MGFRMPVEDVLAQGEAVLKRVGAEAAGERQLVTVLDEVIVKLRFLDESLSADVAKIWLFP